MLICHTRQVSQQKMAKATFCDQMSGQKLRKFDTGMQRVFTSS